MEPQHSTFKRKIFMEPRELLPYIEHIKQQGAKIVFGNGCFELLHVGHIRYLFGAKALGDMLIVAVNTDSSIQMIKPDHRPVNPDWERMELIAAIEAVDFVVPLRERDPISLLELLRPHIHTKGTDYTLEKIPERAIVESYGGRVAIVGDPKDHSTSGMITKIQKRT